MVAQSEIFLSVSVAASIIAVVVGTQVFGSLNALPMAESEIFQPALLLGVFMVEQAEFNVMIPRKHSFIPRRRDALDLSQPW